jgi:glycosyltransferase involved in cell wall biosynthesis
MKISIVTAYFNRKDLFRRTLKSISLSNFKDFEVIAVDDCSSNEHRIEDLINEFPFLQVIRLEKADRWYVNPCVPFNVGFNKAVGEIVVIQNPECFHFGDILSYINERLTENDYFSFSTYAITKAQTDVLSGVNYENIIGESRGVVLPYVESVFRQEGIPGWYNHTKYRPVAYHFCSAMYKNKLDELNGFDERFAKGIAYDDNDFITRIGRNKMNIKIIDELTVFHQYHIGVSYQIPNAHALHERNKQLFFGVTSKENKIYAENNLVIRSGV